MTTWFAVREGRLRVSSDDPPFEWEGPLDGMPVLDLIAVPTEASAVVLLDPPAGQKAVRNLVGVDSNAAIAWRAEVPTTDASDCFVSIELYADGLIAASTWSGYRVVLAAETGELLRKEFTK